ncbi:MAG: hypothetical protein OXR67_07695 [Chloroflexota bacterium]|nr:hypothetical protein [Chloroflexota bacterium]
MQEIREVIRHSKSHSPWVDRLLRLLMIAVLAVVFALAGTAFAEYRVLYAVASLPQTEGGTTLNLDCSAVPGEGSGITELALRDDAAIPRVPMILQGLRCSIPLYPD